MPTLSLRHIDAVLTSILDRFDLPGPFDAARWQTVLAVAALGMGVLTLGMLALDDRLIDGEPVWLKPFKFAASFAVFFATLAAVSARLTDRWRRSWVLVVATMASAAAFTFEMAYIGAQAARAEASHFNETTPFHELMYSLMGTGASVLMATVTLLGIIAYADRGARMGPATRLAVSLGFGLTVILTLWVAGELAGNGGRHVGVPGPEARSLPILGWSREVGDLRPAHFLSLHMMQVLPVVGLLLDRNRRDPRLVWAFAALYAALTALVFFQALAGYPVISY
jgi:hypothetical protein